MNIKEYVKSNKVLYKILSPIKFFVCSFIKARLIQYAFYIKRYFVYQGIVKENAQFNIIKKDRQKYKGKRCFIIGAGPSIKIEDLNLLKDEFTITMSTIIKFLDELEYIPDIYMVQDRISFLYLYKDIKKFPSNRLYIGMGNIKQEYQIKMQDIFNLKKYKDCKLFHLDTAYIWDNLPFMKWNPIFSTSVDKFVYDGGTTAYSAIQLAAYMGFSDIYLLGIDCNYTGSINHFGEESKSYTKEKIKSLKKMEERLKISFKKAYEETKKINVNLYNATRGGALNTVPRVNLDEILRK